MRISILPSRVDIRNARSNGLVGDRGIWIRVLLPERDFDISTAHKLHDIPWPPHRCVETGTLLPPSTGSQGVPGSNSAGAQRHLWLLLFLCYLDCYECLKLRPRDRCTPWPLTRYRNWKEWTPVCAFLLDSVPSSDTSIVGTCKQVEELDWPNSARWSDKKKKIPPLPPLCLTAGSGIIFQTGRSLQPETEHYSWVFSL